jgi:hypothetical protein
LKYLTLFCAAGIAALPLSGCVEESTARDSSGMREASSAAESACMTAVNKNYGGNVDNIDITSSESSQANSVVMMRAGGETWKCLVSSGGVVQELTVVGG